jgi:hypothetical protein
LPFRDFFAFLLKSTVWSDPLITCLEPTLFTTSFDAASDVPPRARKSVTSEMTMAGDGR